jgi:D-lactate dehydrogenase (cytochrome)
VLSECVELLDDNMMDAINHAGLSRPFPVKDSLFFKFQGSPSSIAETSKLVHGIVKSHGAELFQSARSVQEAAELWNHRKVGFWSTFEWVDDPNTKIWSTDVCVPRSKLPQLVKETKDDMAKHGILSTILGHVGDGKNYLLGLQLSSLQDQR